MQSEWRGVHRGTGLFLLCLGILLAGCVQDADNTLSWDEPIPHHWLTQHAGTCTNLSKSFSNTTATFQPCINEEGFRDRTYSLEKPGNTLRIIALGDWITFGAVEDNETWPNLLEQQLNTGPYDRRYEVLNFGLEGRNTRREIVFFSIHGLKYDPDLVIIQFVDNDAQNLTWIEHRAQEYTARNTSMDRKTARLQAILEERRKRWDRPIEEQLSTVELSLQHLETLSERHGFEVIFLYYTAYTDERYGSALRDMVDPFGWSFTEIDLDDRPHPDGTSYTYDHTIDPTPTGHSVIAREVHQHLQQEDLLE